LIADRSMRRLCDLAFIMVAREMLLKWINGFDDWSQTTDNWLLMRGSDKWFWWCLDFDRRDRDTHIHFSHTFEQSNSFHSIINLDQTWLTITGDDFKDIAPQECQELQWIVICQIYKGTLNIILQRKIDQMCKPCEWINENLTKWLLRYVVFGCARMTKCSISNTNKNVLQMMPREIIFTFHRRAGETWWTKQSRSDHLVLWQGTCRCFAVRITPPSSK
jgi:hypothetical protein